MSWITRLFGIKEGKATVPFGSVMPQLDLDAQLKQLHEQLQQITGMRELEDLAAWRQMRKVFLTQIGDCEDYIVSLAGDPVRNQVTLIETKAVRDTLGAIVLMQDNLPADAERIQAAIHERLNLLKQVEDLPRPSENAPSDVPPSF